MTKSLINANNFKELTKIINENYSDKTVIVIFTTNRCYNCSIMKENIVSLISERKSLEHELIEINCAEDKWNNLVKDLHILFVPITFVFKKNGEIEQLKGAYNKNELIKILF